MRVEEIMSRRVVTVELDDTLETVKDIFDHVRFHHLLVVEHGKLFGLLSDRDLLKALSPNIGTLLRDHPGPCHPCQKGAPDRGPKASDPSRVGRSKPGGSPF